MTRNVITIFFKYRKWIYTILVLPVLAGFIYQLIYYYVYPLPYISWSRFQLILFPIVEVLFLLVCFDIFIHRSNENNKSTLGWQLAFIFLGVNLLALSSLAGYYESRAQSPSSQLFLSLVPVLKGFLIFSIVLCFFIGFSKRLSKHLEIVFICRRSFAKAHLAYGGHSPDWFCGWIRIAVIQPGGIPPLY